MFPTMGEATLIQVTGLDISSVVASSKVIKVALTVQYTMPHARTVGEYLFHDNSSGFSLNLQCTAQTVARDINSVVWILLLQIQYHFFDLFAFPFP